MTTTTLSPADFEKALKRACLRAVARVKYHDPYAHGDRSAVRDGALIGDIADEAGISIPMARRRLQALQAEGKVIRDDRRGGSTAWWLVGLAAERGPKPSIKEAVPMTITLSGVTTQQQAARVADHAFRQTLTASTARQHWSDVLGVPRDASTSEVREARSRALAAVNEFDLDAAQQRERIQSAYTARLTEDGISEYE